jgi:cation:H+ antiporter
MNSTALMYFALILLACFLLVKSVSLMIESSSHFAKLLHVSEYTVSVFMIAMATSFPELIFGIAAASNNDSLLSFGNVLGSNIADLTIIIAVPILIGGALSTRAVIRNKDLAYAGLFGLLPVLFILDGNISRIDAGVLIVTYIIYLIYVMNRERNNSEPLQIFKRERHWLKNLIIFLVSVVVMLISAELMVGSSMKFSEAAKVPAFFIGLIVTAIGTSIPELVFGLKVIRTRQRGEILGSILGSVVVNSTLVIGATALIQPIIKQSKTGNSSILFMLVTLVFFFLISLTKKRLSRFEAVLLIILYIAFALYEKNALGL